MIRTLKGGVAYLDDVEQVLPGCNSAFETDSIELLDKAYETARKNRNPKDHNNVTASINKYRNFLADTGMDRPAHVSDIESLPLIEKGDTACSAEYNDEMFLNEVFLDDDSLRKLKVLLKRKRNLILQGAPGTGKTFTAKRLAYAMMGCMDLERIEIVQFNQNTTYDDFVFGYRPNLEGSFTPAYGPFIKLCNRARDANGSPFFLIIDEINRANISSVFGDMLMLIESSHRDESIRLNSSGSLFSVPKNLFIVGTMNTADRGLALIDYALRRRFAFFEMNPAFENDKFKQLITESDNLKLTRLVEATKSLNIGITRDLGKGFRIGHSYFCVDEVIDVDTLHAIVDYELAPLIDEYWFDDEERARKEIDRLRKAIDE